MAARVKNFASMLLLLGVLSILTVSAWGDVEVKFTFYQDLEDREWLKLVGNTSVLGDGIPENAPYMTPTAGHNWTLNVSLAGGEAYEVKVWVDSCYCEPDETYVFTVPIGGKDDPVGLPSRDCNIPCPSPPPPPSPSPPPPPSPSPPPPSPPPPSQSPPPPSPPPPPPSPSPPPPSPSPPPPSPSPPPPPSPSPPPPSPPPPSPSPPPPSPSPPPPSPSPPPPSPPPPSPSPPPPSPSPPPPSPSPPPPSPPPPSPSPPPPSPPPPSPSPPPPSPPPPSPSPPPPPSPSPPPPPTPVQNITVTLEANKKVKDGSELRISGSVVNNWDPAEAVRMNLDYNGTWYLNRTLTVGTTYRAELQVDECVCARNESLSFKVEIEMAPVILDSFNCTSCEGSDQSNWKKMFNLIGRFYKVKHLV